MKLVDNIYQLYKDQLTGYEEDAIIIVSGLLEELEREHFFDWFHEMSDEEIFEMFGNYLVSKLYLKMTQDGIGNHNGGRDPNVGEGIH